MQWHIPRRKIAMNFAMRIFKQRYFIAAEARKLAKRVVGGPSTVVSQLPLSNGLFTTRTPIGSLKVGELKAELIFRKLPVSGLKADLLQRLRTAMEVCTHTARYTFLSRVIRLWSSSCVTPNIVFCVSSAIEFCTPIRIYLDCRGSRCLRSLSHL
jgi:hypothetical protein